MTSHRLVLALMSAMTLVLGCEESAPPSAPTQQAGTQIGPTVYELGGPAANFFGFPFSDVANTAGTTPAWQLTRNGTGELARFTLTNTLSKAVAVRAIAVGAATAVLATTSGNGIAIPAPWADRDPNLR